MFTIMLPYSPTPSLTRHHPNMFQVGNPQTHPLQPNSRETKGRKQQRSCQLRFPVVSSYMPVEADVVSVTRCLIQPQFGLSIASKSTAARNGTGEQTLLPSAPSSPSFCLSFYSKPPRHSELARRPPPSVQQDFVVEEKRQIGEG